MNKIKKSKSNKISKTQHELILVTNGDDWEALYLDGKKVEAHHKVSRETISEYTLKYQAKMVKKFVTDKYNTEYAQDMGDFHEELSEVELEKE